MLSRSVVSAIQNIVGKDYVYQDNESCEKFGVDALGQGHPADVVVFPRSTLEVSAIARLCNDEKVPLTPRGGGTGYTGGAVPSTGGVVLVMERFDKILSVDESNLLAVVEPNVVTADLHRAVESVGLFYPPDPASAEKSVIGGNVAECAGGPRAFKYGTTKRYVLGLEAVLPTGEIIRTGGKSIKNVVGYDLTQLLVGSEGTLAIITQVILRLLPKPLARSTIRAMFSSVDDAVSAVDVIMSYGVLPATLELIDSECLRFMLEKQSLYFSSKDARALLLIDVDGMPASVSEEVTRVKRACVSVGATEVMLARDEIEQEEVWRLRRELSVTLRSVAPLKINHDVVVPKGRIPELFSLIQTLRKEFALQIASFGHIGDGNIHVNIMLDPKDSETVQRARQAERRLFKGVVELEGSISGEHGIGFSKAQYLGLELSSDVISLMQRLKSAFDPNGILNPGKIFPLKH